MAGTGAGRGDRTRYAVVAAALTGFVVLTVLVLTHVTDPLDVAVRNYFRPGDEWGPTQMHADWIVNAARPSHMAPVLAVVAVVVALIRRSWRSIGLAAVVGVLAAVPVVAFKALYWRPDPHYERVAWHGSYPSGHTMTVLVVLGGSVLVLTTRTRWWQWLIVGAGGAVMIWALLAESAHWATDVAGSALLAVAVLTLASMSPLRRPVDPPARTSEDLERSPHAGQAPAASRADAAHR